MPDVEHEEWRPIPGYDGYEVSDLGRVRSWRTPGRTDRRADAPRVLAPRVNQRGCPSFLLRRGDGRLVTVSASRVVATLATA